MIGLTIAQFTFVIFMGYFSTGLNWKMYIIALFGTTLPLTIGVITNIHTAISKSGEAIAAPMYIWAIVGTIWIILFIFGKWLNKYNHENALR